MNGERLEELQLLLNRAELFLNRFTVFLDLYQPFFERLLAKHRLRFGLQQVFLALFVRLMVRFMLRWHRA